MSTNDNLFILNPLTAIFLCGVATQLILILYVNNDHTGVDMSQYLNSKSDRRIDRWQIIFHDFCTDYYNMYSEVYEKDEFDSEIQLNPFIVHSNLLIKYSTKILNFIKSHKIGIKTLKKVSSWFILMSQLKHSPRENVIKLLEIQNEYNCVENEKNGCDRGKEFIEFNPMSLLIRSAFIVNIHQKRFSINDFRFWVQLNVRYFAQHLPIQVYKNEFNMEEKPIHFSPEFPILHHLKCKEIYTMWSVSFQKSSTVPVYQIYLLILKHMHGNMMTLHCHQRHQFNFPCKNEIENITIFQRFYSDSEKSIMDDLRKVKNCEKQSLHQLEKRRKINGNNTLPSKNNIADTGLGGNDFFNFLFPKTFFGRRNVNRVISENMFCPC